MVNGQGSVGLELLEQEPDLDAIVVLAPRAPVELARQIMADPYLFQSFPSMSFFCSQGFNWRRRSYFWRGYICAWICEHFGFLGMVFFFLNLYLC